MLELFLRALFTKSNKVQSAIRDLEEIVSEEEKMAVTDVVVGMHELSAHSASQCLLAMCILLSSQCYSDWFYVTTHARIERHCSSYTNRA